MKTNLRIVGVAGLALVMTCAARGAVYFTETHTYRDPLGSGTSPVPFNDPHTIDVDQFNTQGGTRVLTSISFTLDATMYGNYTAYNPPANGGSRTVSSFFQSGDFTATYSGGTLVESWPTSVAVDVNNHSTYYTLKSGETKPWTGISGTDSQSASYDGTWEYFGDYQGSGTKAVTLNAASQTGTLGGTGITYGSSAYGFSDFTVTYTYVPEPANVALGIFGAASLVVLVVRSRPVRSRMQELKGALSRWVDAV